MDRTVTLKRVGRAVLMLATEDGVTRVVTCPNERCQLRKELAPGPARR